MIVIVTDLGPGTTYYFALQSVTNRDYVVGNNVVFYTYTLVSDLSAEVTATTLPRSGPTQRLSVATAGPGVGSVTSSPPGINCAGLCSGSFAQGIVVTLTASDASVFAGWGGDCSGTAPSCQMTMDVARSVTARFPPIPTAERAALIALYNSTAGWGWTRRTNWRNADDSDFNAVGWYYEAADK